MFDKIASPIQRIAAPSPEAFQRDFVETQTPVILEGAISGKKIGAIRTEADAVETLGWLRIPVATEYFHATSSASIAEAPRNMRLDEYLDTQLTSPNNHRMCSEQPTPQVLLADLQLPAYDTYDDAISSFFVGHQGQAAHMHFDGDYRHVLFHQVFGTKRMILISPAANHLLPASGNFLEWSIESFSEQEIARLLTFTGGVECVLQAGETLYMPAAIWHYVGYTTNSMSVNIRFGRREYGRFLAEKVHLSKYAQAIAWKFSNPSKLSAKDTEQFDRIKRAVDTHHPSGERRYEDMEQTLEKVADQLYGREASLVFNPEHLRTIYRQGSIELYQTAIDKIAHEVPA